MKLNVVRLAFVYYRHPDLERAVQFLKDFGFNEVYRDNGGSRVYFAGCGLDPFVYIAEQAPDSRRAFLGGAWALETEQDLEAAASHPDASGVKEVTGPGGGKYVSIIDPNGFPVMFVYGQKLREFSADEATTRIDGAPRAYNFASEKLRRGEFCRFIAGPSPIHKAGHYGFIVPKSNYQKTLDWYTSLMNIVPTDSVYDPETEEDVTCFLHIDRGMEYTDHHSFFIGANPTEKPAFVHHSSYEVNDIDTQSLGHDHLQNNGYTNCWGIGRHVLGSQIFDYWFDISGNIVEHYSDGDVVNQETPFTRSPEAPDSLHIWGPRVPLGFVTGQVEDAGKTAN